MSPDNTSKSNSGDQNAKKPESFQDLDDANVAADNDGSVKGGFNPQPDPPGVIRGFEPHVDPGAIRTPRQIL